MTETYLATKQELKKHHLSEVQKQFKYFEPMMSLNKNEHAFYLGSTINSTVKLPDNPFQKFIITDYNINVNEAKVIPPDFNLMALSNRNINGTYVRSPSSRPICIKKAFRPDDDIVYNGDLLFIYEEMEETELAKKIVGCSWAWPYIKYREMDYFVEWYRKILKCSDFIHLSRLSIAYDNYQKKRRTAKFDVNDLLSEYEKVDTYLFF